MKIRGVEFEFSIDNIDDYRRFEKAHVIMAKKIENKKSSFGIEDMEIFLRGCIPKQACEEMLADRRISTLNAVFVEFFDSCIKERLALRETYDSTAAKITEAQKMMEELEGFGDADAPEEGADEDYVV